MSTRLQKGGRLIDRSKALSFTFNGKPMKGFAGDTLASAMLGADQMMVGRSFKYHRPRGVVASGVRFRDMAHRGELPGVTKSSW